MLPDFLDLSRQSDWSDPEQVQESAVYAGLLDLSRSLHPLGCRPADTGLHKLSTQLCQRGSRFRIVAVEIDGAAVVLPGPSASPLACRPLPFQ